MLELLLELLAEILVNLLLEVGINRMVDSTRNNGWTICMIIVGGGLGWASTALWGKPLLPWTALQVASIVVVPIVVATIISKLSKRRLARGGRPGLLDDWTDAYLFSLAFSVVRFAATW